MDGEQRFRKAPGYGWEQLIRDLLDQQAELEEMKAKIEDLESRIEALESP